MRAALLAAVVFLACPTTAALAEPPAQGTVRDPRAPSAATALRQCMQAPNYSRCVIEALDHGRRSQTCAELKQVIEAYQTLGDRLAAMLLTRSWVERCGDDRGLPVDRPSRTRRV